MSLKVINGFDPWGHPLCTCPRQYNLNPYTGCNHGCIYCYASFIPRFYQPRRKLNLIEHLREDLKQIPPDSQISMSNTSDSYLPLDKTYQDTRQCFQLFTNYNFKHLIVTKSNLILRDIDILKSLRVAVMITITTLDDKIQRRLEPGTISPQKRLDTVGILNNEGIPTGIRYDPILYQLTDIETPDIIKSVHDVNAKMVTSSTLRPRPDFWDRLQQAVPEYYQQIKPLYKWVKQYKAYYLPADVRLKIVSDVATECKKYNLPFAVCREEFKHLNTALTCNGTHLIRN